MNIRLFAGELLHEVHIAERRRQATHGKASSALDWHVEGIDLIMAVLARHIGETIDDDHEFPVEPLPITRKPGWIIEERD